MGQEGRSMARRPLLTDEERRLLFGVPSDPDALARHYTFTRSDQDLVAGRRGDTNRLGFAVQLALPQPAQDSRRSCAGWGQKCPADETYPNCVNGLPYLRDKDSLPTDSVQFALTENAQLDPRYDRAIPEVRPAGVTHIAHGPEASDGGRRR